MDSHTEENAEIVSHIDATICTEDGWCFPVCKTVLAMNSKYFAVLFAFENERFPQTFTIPNVRGKIMEFILDYIYKREVLFNENNIDELIMASDYLLLDQLLHRCWTYASHTVTVNNCVDLYTTASLLEQSRLKRYYHHFILFHFERIIRCTESGVQNLPLKLLEDVLSANSLKVHQENLVWRAIMQWTLKDYEERLQFVDRLINCIRSRTEYIYFLTDITYNPIFPEYHVKRCMENSLVSRTEKDINLEPRQPDTIVIFSKHVKTNTRYPGKLTVNVTFDETMFRWREIDSRYIFWPNKMLVVNETAYLFNTWTGENTGLNLITKQWITIPSMRYKRRKFTLVQFEQHIYAFGGVSYFQCDDAEKSVTERYNPKLNKWETLSPNRCKTVNAVEIGGLIYAFGRCNFEGVEPIMLMEVYEAYTDTWTQLIPPILPRYNFAMIVFKRRIFILGGIHDDMGKVAVVDVFNPYEQVWEMFEELPHRYEFPQAIIFENTLVVFDEINECPPVYWNESDGTWRRFLFC